MNALTKTAIVALTAGIIGLAGAVPAATAQQQPPQGAAPGQQMQPHMQRHGFNHFNMRPNMRPQMRSGRGANSPAGMLTLVCSDRGAERLEIALVRLSHRVNPTAEQAPLLEDLRTTALTAQTQFADSCKAARPTAEANARPAMDPVARMRAMIDLDKARIAALETVLPKFEAFFNSLTDAQKAELAPRGGRMGRGHNGQGMGMMQPRPGMTQNDMNPPAPPALSAPSTPPPAAPTTM